MSEETPTPRTDAETTVCKPIHIGLNIVHSTLAQELERELAAEKIAREGMEKDAEFMAYMRKNAPATIESWIETWEFWKKNPAIGDKA
jgi:hypothetical protein